MALRMLTEKVTGFAARHYQKAVASQLQQTGTSLLSNGTVDFVLPSNAIHVHKTNFSLHAEHVSSLSLLHDLTLTFPINTQFFANTKIGMS